MLSRTIVREDLYDLIWAMPATKLAKELGISDVGLGKICKRMEVPKPPLGYWRKVEVGGQPPKRPKLKKLSSKGQQQVTITPSQPENRSLQTIRKAEAIPCPTELIEPHRLTTKTLASLDKSKTDGRGVLLSRNKICLDLRVTQQSLQRACLIMDSLIKALESRGHKVMTEGEYQQKTVVEFESKRIVISLDERVHRIDHIPTPDETKEYKRYPWMIPRYDHAPTGLLCLRIHDWDAPRKVWSDGKRQRLEGCLGSFIQGIEETAKQMEASDERRRLDKIRWEEERRKREEEERLARIQAKKVKKLISDSDNWHQAERLRAYIAQMETLPEIDEALSAWIDWANSYIEELDPLNNLEALPFIIDEHSSYY